MKNKYTFVGFLLLVLSFQGCSELQKNNMQEDNNAINQPENFISSSAGNFVSKQLAVYTAKQFSNSYGFSYSNLLKDKALKSKESDKTIAHVLEVQDQDKTNAIYLVNYNDGGFVIISGDKRVNPILAYSKKNLLPSKTDEKIPGGLSVWIRNKVHAVSTMRSEKLKKSKTYAAGWKSLLNANKPDSAIKSTIEPPDPCQPYFVEKGPLLKAEWGQADGYNNAAPDLGCNYPYNGKAYSGCVATAMSQVMRYYEYPSSYDWDAMPDQVQNPSSYGSEQISTLMYDVGEVVDMD